MLVLLPPSEGKAAGGAGLWRAGSGRFGRRLRGPRVEVIEELAEHVAGLSEAQASKFFGVKGDALATARADTEALAARPRSLGAAERYTGVVMGHVDLPTLSGPARRWFDDQVAFVSGMHGLLGASDPTPPYRLKMGASLPAAGRLSAFWTPHLDRIVAGHDLVVDLLTNEHRSAFTVDAHPGVWLRIDLARADAKPAGHAGKAAKGLLVRHLAEVAPATADQVLEACVGGPWPAQPAGSVDRPAVAVTVVD